MIKTYKISTNDFEQASKEEIYDYFKNKEFVQLDLETMGFDPHTSYLLCAQFGDYDNQFVVSGDWIEDFKELIEEKILIGQNLKFDIRFLYKRGIWPNKVFDTFLAETVLTCGLKTVRRNLPAIAKKYLDVELDKEVRDSIWKEGLTKRVIEYAANDVKYLEKIRDAQMELILAQNLQHTLEVENQFVMVLAYIEFSGFKLDEAKWKSKIEGDLIDLKVAEENLDKWIIENKVDKFISRQTDLLSSVMPVLINWSSSRQVVKLFNHLGIDTKIVEKGKEKDSVEAKHIGKYRKDYKIVDLYMIYKEMEKEVSTYGETFIKQINPSTGRVHTNFKQIMNTGRLSSGGKNKMTGEEYINFQNIPATPDEKDKIEGAVYPRECFICEEGNSLIIADYTGQEQIVLANKSLDKGLLEFYDKGLGDMHCFVASKMYPELEGLSFDVIKKEHKEKRQKAKTAGFAINYGGVGATIAKNNNLSIEEGEFIYESYFNAFPNLPDYFAGEKQKALTNGYIEFNDILKTRSYIDNFDKYKEREARMNKNFWDRWKIVKKNFLEKGKLSDEYYGMKQEIRDFFTFRGGIERDAQNYNIQGTSASITKIAGIYFFRRLRQKKLLGVVFIPNCVHDEYVVECKNDLVEEIKNTLVQCMIKAGEIFCKRVPLKVDSHTALFWKK